jgi:hypothetical protein
VIGNHKFYFQSTLFVCVAGQTCDTFDEKIYTQNDSERNKCYRAMRELRGFSIEMQLIGSGGKTLKERPVVVQCKRIIS